MSCHSIPPRPLALAPPSPPTPPPPQIVTIPSLNHFTNAIKACDPAYRRLYHRCRGALTSFDVVAAGAAVTAAARAAAAVEKAQRMTTDDDDEEEDEEEEEEEEAAVEMVSVCSWAWSLLHSVQLADIVVDVDWC